MDIRDWFCIGLLIFLALFAAIISIVGIRLEKKIFNNGKCTECNTQLRLFDCDSHGGRGWICDKCGRIVWVSYKRVDLDYFKKFFYKAEEDR